MLRWHWLGTIAHDRAVALQDERRQRLWRGDDAAAGLLCEHPPVITLGRSARDGDVRIDPDDARRAGIAIARVDRGGDVTYHGPGQLMIYPVVRIRSVVQFLDDVGHAIAAQLASLGAVGARFERSPCAGIWVGDRKLAACGLHVSRGVSIHGFAVNVATPPERWRAIVACRSDAPQVSLAQLREARTITATDVAALVGPAVCRALSRPRAA